MRDLDIKKLKLVTAGVSIFPGGDFRVDALNFSPAVIAVGLGVLKSYPIGFAYAFFYYSAAYIASYFAEQEYAVRMVVPPELAKNIGARYYDPLEPTSDRHDFVSLVFPHTTGYRTIVY